jgi:hypothetical protein
MSHSLKGVVPHSPALRIYRHTAAPCVTIKPCPFRIWTPQSSSLPRWQTQARFWASSQRCLREKRVRSVARPSLNLLDPSTSHWIRQASDTVSCTVCSPVNHDRQHTGDHTTVLSSNELLTGWRFPSAAPPSRRRRAPWWPRHRVGLVVLPDRAACPGTLAGPIPIPDSIP